MNFTKTDRSDGLFLMAGWVLILLFINPIGDYPTNDDWAYAQIVKRFVETGVYDLGFWPGMTLFTHVMWGSLFCTLFGFSFTVLRLATLCLAIAGSFIFLKLLKELLREDLWSRRIGLAALVCNPFFLLLSFSYMTDVPFLTFVLSALFFFKRAYEKDRLTDWGLALLFSIIAILTRQLALLLPLAFSFTLLLKKRTAKHILLAISIFSISFLSLHAYTSYMEATVGLPPPFGRPESLLKRVNVNFILGQLKYRGGIHLFYWSIFLVPFVAITGISVRRKKIDAIILALVILICGYFYFFSWGVIPIGNLFYATGFGPITLLDVEKGFSGVKHISPTSWLVIQAITFPFAVAIMYRGVKKAWWAFNHRKKFSDTQLWKLAIFLMLIGYSSFMLIDIHKFDRYFFPLYSLLILLLASGNRSGTPSLPQKVVSLGSLAVMAVFSLIATRDYHAWQEARWTALEELVKDQGISPRLIDGGFEFNGWYETGPSNPSGRDRKSWWFVDEDEYAIARQAFECYEVIRTFPTHTWLDPLGDSLVVLKRPSLSRIDTLFTGMEVLSADGEEIWSADSLYVFGRGGKLDSTVAFKGRNSVLLTPEHPYGVSIDLYDVQGCEQISVTSWRLGNSGSAGSVLRAPDVNVLHSFERYFVDEKNENGWMKLRHELTVPSYYQSDTLHFYFWNPVPDSVWIDDLQIIRRRQTLGTD